MPSSTAMRARVRALGVCTNSASRVRTWRSVNHPGVDLRRNAGTSPRRYRRSAHSSDGMLWYFLDARLAGISLSQPTQRNARPPQILELVGCPELHDPRPRCESVGNDLSTPRMWRRRPDQVSRSTSPLWRAVVRLGVKISVDQNPGVFQSRAVAVKHILPAVVRLQASVRTG